METLKTKGGNPLQERSLNHPYPWILKAEWELEKEKDPEKKTELEKELMESYTNILIEEENEEFHHDWLSEEENKTTKNMDENFFKSPVFAPLDGDGELEYAEDFDMLLENIA